VHIAPASIISSEFTINAGITIGDHSRIFPFCWLDAGEGITIGKHVGVGGHTLMFTHGVWSNYVDGGPINFGPISIEDNVWLPWRVFILPNVVIGENAIIGANSLVNKNVEPNILAAGSPAKEIQKLNFDKTKKKERFNMILKEYASYLRFKNNTDSKLEDDMLVFKNNKIVIDRPEEVTGRDLLILIDISVNKLDPSVKKKLSILDYENLSIHLNGNKSSEIKQFITYLRRFGVRLHINK
jgi:acetyltransferase-like isoleucine patch superfamily enzyme